MPRAYARGHAGVVVVVVCRKPSVAARARGVGVCGAGVGNSGGGGMPCCVVVGVGWGQVVGGTAPRMVAWQKPVPAMNQGGKKGGGVQSQNNKKGLELGMAMGGLGLQQAGGVMENAQPRCPRLSRSLILSESCCQPQCAKTTHSNTRHKVQVKGKAR